jgi:predicted RNase H-like HicB family nuclease
MSEFPAIVFPDPEGRFVVTFPDLFDCVAFANSLEDAPKAAATVLGALLAEIASAGEAAPLPSSLEAVRNDPQNQDCMIILVSAPGR